MLYFLLSLLPVLSFPDRYPQAQLPEGLLQALQIKEEALKRGFHSEFDCLTEMDKFMDSKWTSWKKESYQGTYALEGEKERAEAFSPEMRLLEWAAFDGVQGTMIRGNPFIPLDLSFETDRMRPSILAESYLPLNLGHKVHGWWASERIRHMDLIKVENVSWKGKSCLYLLGGSPPKAYGSKEEDPWQNLIEIWLDVEETLLLLKVVEYVEDPLAGTELRPGPSLEIQGVRYREWVEWEVEDWIWVDRLPVVARGKQVDYFYSSKNPSHILRNTTEISIRKDSMLFGSIACAKVEFAIPPLLGSIPFDRELGLAVLNGSNSNRRTIGITPRQLAIFEQMVLDPSSTERPPELGIQAAVEDLRSGVEANCASISGHLFLRSFDRPSDFHRFISLIEMDETGSTSILNLKQAVARFGMETEVLALDSERVTELPGPVIVHEKVREGGEGHFWLLLRSREDWFKVDPPGMPEIWNLSQFDLLEREFTFLVSKEQIPNPSSSLAWWGAGFFLAMGGMAWRRLRRGTTMMAMGFLTLIPAACGQELKGSQETAALQSAPWLQLQDASSPIILEGKDVFVGADIERTLSLRNEGPQDLQISSIASSCGCTGTEVQTMSLAPGQETTLTVRIHVDQPGFRVQLSLSRFSVDQKEEVPDLEISIWVRAYSHGLSFKPGLLQLSSTGEAEGEALWASAIQPPPQAFILEGSEILMGEGLAIEPASWGGGFWTRRYRVQVSTIEVPSQESGWTEALQPSSLDPGEDTQGFPALRVVWPGTEEGPRPFFLGAVRPGELVWKEALNPEEVSRHGPLHVVGVPDSFEAFLVVSSRGCQLGLRLEDANPQSVGGPFSFPVELKSRKGKVLRRWRFAGVIPPSSLAMK
ncbi:MAG: DUF1573 domain-containing protein [Planctomycetota bacterium]|nr:MAG: DUF1573 domain-containing protein [Planctomycetota bacterium]